MRACTWALVPRDSSQEAGYTSSGAHLAQRSLPSALPCKLPCHLRQQRDCWPGSLQQRAAVSELPQFSPQPSITASGQILLPRCLHFGRCAQPYCFQPVIFSVQVFRMRGFSGIPILSFSTHTKIALNQDYLSLAKL